ncbi:MAG: hypothetical protein PVI90_12590 [Desulfobacteraceae bacterium]
MPEKSLVESLVSGNNMLKDALESHQQMINTLPELVGDRISQEVILGIKPVKEEINQLTSDVGKRISTLTTELGQSHQDLSDTLLTINTEGYLSDWIGSLKETVTPLENATRAIEVHYVTAESLLNQSREFTTQWAGNWQNIAGKFSTFTEEFTRWASSETTHMRDIEHRIMNRLEEEAESKYLIAESLNGLQKAKTQLLESGVELNESMNKINSHMLELKAFIENTQNQHSELLHHQREFQTAFQTWQTNIQDQTEVIQNTTADFVKNVESDLNTILTCVKEKINELVTDYQQLHKAREQQLDLLINKMTSSYDADAVLVTKQRQLVDTIEKIVNLLPNRNVQLISLVVQLLILILVAVYVLPPLLR